MKDYLDNCPHCGHVCSMYVDWDDRGLAWWVVQCVACGAETRFFSLEFQDGDEAAKAKYKAETIAKFNRRRP